MTEPPLAPLLRRYTTDRNALWKFHDLPFSATVRARKAAFLREWADRPEVGAPDDTDATLLRNHLATELDRLDRDAAREAEIADLVPFAGPVIALEEARRRLEPAAGRSAAEDLEGLRGQLKARRDAGLAEVPPALALRAAKATDALREVLEKWFRHFDGYDPEFSWWARKPFESAKAEMEAWAKSLREDGAHTKGEDDDPLVGDPVGREAILADLRAEMMAETPEEMIATSEAHYAWCLGEMKRAAAEIGFEDDWRAALEHVKTLHVAPGAQARMVARQAEEAVEFCDAHDLVTIDPLCRETWRLEMLDLEGQRRLPFAAYGGQKMLVSFPLDTMEHETKLMSLRGNNEHFTRAITPHELIPGHHLQLYAAPRLNAHREPFSTPFYVEGWTIHWEILQWKLGWARGPEDRIGMLFWRMHRCARIVVSLRFHLGGMSAPEMVDYLIEQVGHDRWTATSEVRRYIGAEYPPLYQCAYLIGGLTVHGMYEALVEQGGWTPRRFHDAVLAAGPLPLALLRRTLMERRAVSLE